VILDFAPSATGTVVHCAGCDEPVPDANVWICTDRVIALCPSCHRSLPVEAHGRRPENSR